MRSIELEIDRLVGYALVGVDKNRIGRLGSAKLGVKAPVELDGAPANASVPAQQIPAAV